MKEFISNLIDVRISLGFVYIPAEALKYFPTSEKKTISVYLNEDSDVENKLTFNRKYQRVYGLKAWYRVHRASQGDEVCIQVLQNKQKFRFVFISKVKPRYSLKKTKKKEYLTGQPINYEGIKYAPLNEAGVIILWTKMQEELNMDYVTSLSPGYQKGGPDAVVKMPVGKGWADKFVEFEFRSKEAKRHKHDFDYIDYIVCWEHNWSDCPVEVIELKSYIFPEEEE